MMKAITDEREDKVAKTLFCERRKETRLVLVASSVPSTVPHEVSVRRR